MERELYIIEGFFYGGIEISLLNMLKQYNYQEKKVTVLSIVNGPLEVQYRELPITVKVLCNETKSFRGKRRLINYIIKYWPSKFVHGLFVGRRSYDTEIAYHNGQPAAIVSGAPKKCKKVAWFHMGFPLGATPNQIDNYINDGAKAIKRYAYFDEIVCVSQRQKETLENLFKEAGSNMANKMIVQHNVIDTKRILRLSQERVDVSFDGMVLVACGRLSEEKGFDRLIVLAEQLKQKNIKYRIWIIGDGNKKTSLINLAEEKNVQENISFLGFQKNPYKYMKQADYIICPSRFESYGLAVAEALVLKKRVLAARCEGTEELLSKEDGAFLLTNEDEAFVEEAVNIILNRV